MKTAMTKQVFAKRQVGVTWPQAARGAIRPSGAAHARGAEMSARRP